MFMAIVFAAFVFVYVCVRLSIVCVNVCDTVLSMHCYTIINAIVFRVLRKQREPRWQSKMSVTIWSCLFDMCVQMKRSPCFMWPAKDIMSDRTQDLFLDEWISFCRRELDGMFVPQNSLRKWSFSLQATGLSKVLILEVFSYSVKHWLITASIAST